MSDPLDVTIPTGALRAFSVSGCILTVAGREPLKFQSRKIRLGKDPENEVSVPDGSVSRYHAELRLMGDGYLLVDLDSTNGTTINGVRIREAWLTLPCTIHLGEASVTVESTESVLLPSEDGPTAMGHLVGRSPAMKRVFDTIRQLAQSDASVLLQGETGTGKEVAALTLHESSCRRNRPFVVVDCASIPASLVESELFGHERGAFSGATQVRKGLFETADGGTVFLDELGELPLTLQTRLLRVLEQGEIRRVGSSKSLAVDVRIIAASNRDLQSLVASGQFRKDLYYRLAVIVLRLPPLRERREDIPLLVEHFLETRPFNRQADGKRRLSSLPTDLLISWERYDFPGNVRELLNLVHRCVALPEPHGLSGKPQEGGKPESSSEDIQPYHEAKEQLLSSFERDYLEHLMAHSSGNLSRAARAAGLDRKHLRNLLKKNGLHSAGSD